MWKSWIYWSQDADSSWLISQTGVSLPAISKKRRRRVIPCQLTEARPNLWNIMLSNHRLLFSPEQDHRDLDRRPASLVPWTDRSMAVYEYLWTLDLKAIWSCGTNLGRNTIPIRWCGQRMHFMQTDGIRLFDDMRGKDAMKNINEKKIGMVGFGHLGSSIAEALVNKGFPKSNLMISPLRQQRGSQIWSWRAVSGIRSIWWKTLRS